MNPYRKSAEMLKTNPYPKVLLSTETLRIVQTSAECFVVEQYTPVSHTDAMGKTTELSRWQVAVDVSDKSVSSMRPDLYMGTILQICKALAQ